MAVDIKSELTRPLALILAALAVLGWVLFVLSSWSSASVQKTQRNQILQLNEKSEKLSADLAQQREAAGALADLQAKVAATREDLTRVSQTRNDIQTELTNAQRSLTATRRDLSEADRNLQTSTQKISEMQSSAEEAVDAAAAATPKPSRGGRRYGRHRSSRSFSVRSR
jgi:chromosome segregation ATPase